MKLIGKALKIIGIIFIAILVLSVVIQIFTPNEPEKKYSEVTVMYPTTNLNIRRGPSTNHRVLETIETNSKLLTTDSVSKGFIMVLNEDSTKFGWASKTYLRESPVSLKAESIENNSQKSALTEEVKKEIFYALVVAQDRAQAEADKKFVVDASDPNYKQSNIEKNIDLYRELEKKYVNDVEKIYNLSSKEINSIKVEGAKKNWPMPKL